MNNKTYILNLDDKGKKSEIEILIIDEGRRFDVVGECGYFYGSVFKNDNKFKAYFGNDGGMTRSWFGTPREKFMDCVIDVLVDSNDYSRNCKVEEAWEIETQTIVTKKLWNLPT